MIDPHRLRVFRTVVATGSVAAAATALGYTPSAISQQLTSLQRETGLQLVERRGRGISPTAAGRTLAAEAGRVLASISAVEALVADLRAGRVGSLSIGYFASAGAAWIPPVVARLIEDFPELRLDLRLSERRPPEQPDCDLEIYVVGGYPSTPEGPGEGYTVHRLTDDPYVAVVPTAHHLAGRAHVTLGELAPEQWVDNDVNRGACRDILLKACAEAGFAPDFRIEAPDYPTAAAFVGAGVGITVMPHLAATRLPSGAVGIPIVDPTPVRRIHLAIKAAVESHPAARRVVELLGATAGIETRG